MTGTVELLPAGSFGVDNSFQPPSQAAMLAIGVQFESRYICIENDLTRPKLWTLDRLKRNADAGIFAMVNYEQGEGTTLGGAAAGVKHGQVAADWRHYLGMPDDLAVVITTDVGVTASQYSAIADFCAAFQETSGGPIGHYHGTTLCAYLENRGLNDLTWMAMATSWSPGGETPAVQVRQKGYVLNGSCDANYVRQPTPFWDFNGTPKPPEDPMPYTLFQCSDADAVFGGFWDEEIAQEIVHLDSPTFLHYRDDLHKPVRATTVAELATAYLIGPLPRDDSRHDWNGSEFKWWSGEGSGVHGTFPATVTIP